MRAKDYSPCEETVADLIREYGMDATLRSVIGHLNKIVVNEAYLLRLRRHLQFALDEYRDRYTPRCSCHSRRLENEDV